MENTIINRVASSPLVTFDLETLYQPGERVVIDIKDQLYEGLILREKIFRQFINDTDWTVYTDRFVAITCTADAIVPIWAFMLLSSALQPYAKKVAFGSLSDLEIFLFMEKLETVSWDKYTDAKVVIKGCSKVNVPVGVYVQAMNHLRPYAASIMFGEPCSTVPLFKKAKR